MIKAKLDDVSYRGKYFDHIELELPNRNFENMDEIAECIMEQLDALLEQEH